MYYVSDNLKKKWKETLYVSSPGKLHVFTLFIQQGVPTIHLTTVQTQNKVA